MTTATIRDVRTGETTRMRVVERVGRRTVTEDDLGRRWVWVGKVTVEGVHWRLEL